MTQKHYITHRFGTHYAIWFRATKSFVALAPPAYDVFSLYTGKARVGAIREHCQQQYGHLEENIPRFVSEVVSCIRHLSDRRHAAGVSLKHRLKQGAYDGPFHSAASYCIGGKSFHIRYVSPGIRFAIHPLIAHLETTGMKKQGHSISCFTANGLLAYSYRGRVIDAFAPEHSEYFTGGLRQLLYSIVYGKSYNSWMMTLHASGIIKNGQAVLFSAAGGSGKSTVAAMLKAHGYSYLSDDFIAAGENGEVYPFPAAISVKEGAAEKLAEFYPELKAMDAEPAHTGKQVRYLPVHNHTETIEAPFPVRALVFISYKREAPYRFEEVDKSEALQLLLKETWVNPDPQKVSCFFSWVEKTRFFRLQYSKTTEALEAAEKLFAQ